MTVVRPGRVRAVMARFISLSAPETAPRLAAVAAFAFFVVLRSISTAPLTGDEPHYLVLTESIVNDGDLKVVNNYENLLYRRYYPGELAPHVVGGENRRTRQYSSHAPGLALIIAPAYVFGGHRGVIVLLAAITALGTAFVWSAAHLLTRNRSAAWFGWAAVTLTLPTALYGSLIYPDPVAAALIAVGGWSLARLGSATGLTPGMLASVSALTAFLPWLHTRLAIPAVFIGITMTMRLWSASPQRVRRAQLVAFVLPLAVGAIAWFAYLESTFGTLDPRWSVGGQTALNAANMLRGLGGILADQEFGLLPNAPVYGITFAGGWFLSRRDPQLALEYALIGVPYTLAMSAYPVWWGGHCPPGRYILPVLLQFGAGAAVLWSATGRAWRRVALIVLAVSIAIVALMTFVQNGALAYNEEDGSARWLEWLTGDTRASRRLPSFVR